MMIHMHDADDTDSYSTADGSHDDGKKVRRAAEIYGCLKPDSCIFECQLFFLVQGAYDKKDSLECIENIAQECSISWEEINDCDEDLDGNDEDADSDDVSNVSVT